MNIDLEKKVRDLTSDEAIYLGLLASQKAKDDIRGNIGLLNVMKPFQEYPKYIAELGIEVKSFEEEQKVLEHSKKTVKPSSDKTK